jgi:hypothetical protein
MVEMDLLTTSLAVISAMLLEGVEEELPPGVVGAGGAI